MNLLFSLLTAFVHLWRIDLWFCPEHIKVTNAPAAKLSLQYKDGSRLWRSKRQSLVCSGMPLHLTDAWSSCNTGLTDETRGPQTASERSDSAPNDFSIIAPGLSCSVIESSGYWAEWWLLDRHRPQREFCLTLRPWAPEGGMGGFREKVWKKWIKVKLEAVDILLISGSIYNFSLRIGGLDPILSESCGC